MKLTIILRALWKECKRFSLMKVDDGILDKIAVTLLGHSVLEKQWNYHNCCQGYCDTHHQFSLFKNHFFPNRNWNIQECSRWWQIKRPVSEAKRSISEQNYIWLNIFTLRTKRKIRKENLLKYKKKWFFLCKMDDFKSNFMNKN